MADERCLCGHTQAEHVECDHPFRPSTVETARHAILTDWYTGDFTQEQLRERLDAYAAAVRAERHVIGKGADETLVEAVVNDIWAAEAQGCLAQKHLDALIAKVRAEKLPAVTCINCGHRMEAFFRDGKPIS